MTAPTRRAALLALAAPALLAAAPGPPETMTYGAHPRQRLDLYRRRGFGRGPALVFVHGGGWSEGSRSAVAALPAYARRLGAALVSVGYRFTPEVDAGGCAEDVAAAAAWTVKNARRIGADPARVFLLGHSSGAHLTALAGVDPRYLRPHRLAPADLAGVVAIDSGSYDAVAEMERLGIGRGRPDDRLGRMYADAFGDDPGVLSPTRIVREGGRYPPFLLIHAAGGLAETQSVQFGEALRRTRAGVEVLAAPGETHMGLLRSFGLPGDPEGERAARFIRSGRLD